MLCNLCFLWNENFTMLCMQRKKSLHRLHTIGSMPNGGVKSDYDHSVFCEGKLYLENFEIEESLSTNEEEELTNIFHFHFRFVYFVSMTIDNFFSIDKHFCYYLKPFRECEC